jgi:lia operon protein LiaG
MGLDGYAHLEASSGRINADFVRLTDDSSFQASSGSITVTLPEDQDFVLDARTSSGRIDLDFPITVEGRIDKNEVEGAVGSGGSLVKVKTSSGGVELRSR